MEDRLREVVRHIGPSNLAKNTAITNRRRWQTVATDIRTSTRVEDLSELLKAYPQFELYIIRGEIDPAKGQISPAYVEADLNLAAQKTGSR
ncbi:DNA-binding protein [Pseudomonas fluvialis]|uniref:DNA-binding protein n=1 Tax=Pseudomonas fluvialis TaxID=1793966 RepID=A0A2I0CR64_9PSED|nr:DNA-binding protein [Pseudomonas pharmacofabricae]PKF71650.1 DNA-binding protein [Pseudomonas pharmacofabricae]